MLQSKETIIEVLNSLEYFDEDLKPNDKAPKPLGREGIIPHIQKMSSRYILERDIVSNILLVERYLKIKSDHYREEFRKEVTNLLGFLKGVHTTSAPYLPEAEFQVYLEVYKELFEVPGEVAPVVPSKPNTLEEAVTFLLPWFVGMEKYVHEMDEQRFCAFCHSQRSGGIGMQIRNMFDFWSDKETPLYKHLQSLGARHPDTMSWMITRGVYRHMKKINTPTI